MRLWSHVLWVVCAGCLVSPLWSLEPYFVETFGGPDHNPNLEGYDGFVVRNGKLQRQPGDPGDQDRAYLRTGLSDYNIRDFIFDVVFTSGFDTITFVGIGAGDWQSQEPGPSARFRIHSPDVAEGYIGVASNLGEHTIGHLLTTGPHCARIEKLGQQVTFSVDLDFNGQFEADASRSYPSFGALVPSLDDQNSHLFFGGGSQTTQIDTVTVAASTSTAIDANPLCGYAPLEVRFALTESEDVASVSWDFGDNTTSPEGEPTHIYTQPGSFAIKAAIMTGSGENFLLNGGLVRVFSLPPTVRFAMEPRRGPAPLRVQFTDESEGNVVSRLWEFGDGVTSTSPMPIHTYEADGEYQVRLNVLGPCQGSPVNESAATDTVNVSSQPYSELVQTGRRCVSLFVTSAAPIKGGEVGIAYDPELLAPTTVKPGTDLPAGAVIRFQSNPSNGCPPESGVDAGFTVGWINSLSETVLTPPGRHELLRICFQLAPAVAIGTCSPLRFVQCLGIPGAPVRNILTDAQDRSVLLLAEDGNGCVLADLPFKRGDSNRDGSFDISDPVATLGCLFLGTECPACADAADANDDGLLNIADPIYLLNWRFGGAEQPQAPFSECGLDPTTDVLDDCDGFPPCQ